MYRRRFLRVFITMAIIIFIGSNSRYLMAQPGPEENILEESEFVGKLSRGLIEKMEEMKKSGEPHIKVGMWIRIDENTESFLKKLESMGHQIV